MKDITGSDGVVGAPNDWVADLENSQLFPGASTGAFKFYYQSDNAAAASATLMNFPGTTNRVLRYQIINTNVEKGSANSDIGRIQADLYGNVGWHEFHYSVRMYFPSSGIKKLETLPGTFGSNSAWMTLAEFWNQYQWNSTDTDPTPARISFGLNKSSSGNGPIRFRVKTEKAVNNNADWDDIWTQEASSVNIPYDQWFRLDIYIKEGNNSTGRFYAAIFDESVSPATKTVLFDVTNWTKNPSDTQNRGYVGMNPFKLYTNGATVNHIRNNGGSLVVYWDDWKLYYGTYNTGGSTTPTVATPTFSPAGGTYSSTQSVTLSTTTSGASIRYTLDGSTPSATVGTVYSGPISVSTTTTVKAVGYKTGETTSAVATATYTISAPGTVVASAGGAFVNTSIASQNGTFTATFNASPSASPNNAIVALSNGSQTAFTGLAAAVRFNPSGNIDARNGGAYAAASTIPYGTGTYAFRLVVNVPAHTYSIYVTPPSGSELTVGTNYAFRTEQNTVSSLNNWVAAVDVAANGGAGTLSVSNFAVGATPPGTPAFTPPPGTYNTAQSVTITSTGSTSIRYTLDGTQPTPTSPLYTGPISISTNTVIRVMGINSGGAAHSMASYTIIPSSSATLNPVADSYAFGGATSTNYGTALVLGAKDDGTTATAFDRVAFVKFDLSGLGFTPTTATLWVTTDATTQAGTLTVNQCTTDSWTETGLTWANKPATGTVIGTATVAAAVVADKSINVSSYVNSQYTGDATKIVTFALTGNNAQLYLKSREAGAADAPTLVLGN